jgi:hypothetical protein
MAQSEFDKFAGQLKERQRKINELLKTGGITEGPIPATTEESKVVAPTVIGGSQDEALKKAKRRRSRRGSIRTSPGGLSDSKIGTTLLGR